MWLDASKGELLTYGLSYKFGYLERQHYSAFSFYSLLAAGGLQNGTLP